MLEVSQPWHTYQPSLHAGGLFEHSSLMKDSAAVSLLRGVEPTPFALRMRANSKMSTNMSTKKYIIKCSINFNQIQKKLQFNV